MRSSSFVFITGAAGGLEKAFSTECASRGWDLFLTDLSDSALSSLSRGSPTLMG
jgi:NADP-dependent 3-hydroxy acid dehydrogenase YdfG